MCACGGGTWAEARQGQWVKERGLDRRGSGRACRGQAGGWGRAGQGCRGKESLHRAPPTFSSSRRQVSRDPSLTSIKLVPLLMRPLVLATSAWSVHRRECTGGGCVWGRKGGAGQVRAGPGGWSEQGGEGQASERPASGQACRPGGSERARSMQHAGGASACRPPSC